MSEPLRYCEIDAQNVVTNICIIRPEDAPAMEQAGLIPDNGYAKIGGTWDGQNFGEPPNAFPMGEAPPPHMMGA